MPPSTKLPDSSSLVTATLHKEYGTNGGITLRTFNGQLIISHVTPATYKATGLKHGLKVLTMNNVDCSVLSEVSAHKLLEGDEMVTFLVQELDTASIPGTLVTAVLFKEDEDAPVGMGVKVVNGQVCVGTIKEGSLAATSDLHSGMILKKINNFDCVGLNAQQAATLMSDSVGEMKIMAQVPGMKKTKTRMTDYLTVTVTLNTEVDMDGSLEEEDSGIELLTAQSLETGKPMIVIKSISKDSPFFGSALRVGMQICAVQNMDCTRGASMEQVYSLLKDNTKQGETLMILANSCGKQRRAPGSFLTVVVTKESADCKLGVHIGTKGGKTFLKKITDGSLASTTELQAGMWIHSINNHCLIGKSSQEAADILAESEGHLTFLCQTAGENATSLTDPSQMCAATMVRGDGDRVGVALKAQKGELIITKNSEGGLAADTGLEVGMRVLQINNVNMEGKSNKDAAELLTGTVGILTILASKPDRAAGSLVVASIAVPEVAEGEKKPSLGLKMKKNPEGTGTYFISGIAEGSLAEATELRVGMILKSVNNVDCASKETLKEVLSMFTQKSGVINILAQVPGGEDVPSASELVTACCVTGKSVPEGSIVIDDDGKIMITDTGATAFFGTALRVGMEILAINNVDHNLFSRTGLQNLLESQEQLIFLAKRQPLLPDVLVTEVIYKELPSTPLGIGLRKQNGKIYISSIKDGTLAATTGFIPGMQLVSIDNEDCVGMSALVIAKALKDASGDITIVASTKEGGESKLTDGVSLVTAIIEKGEKDSKVGLSFIRKGGLLVITKIAEGSVAAETDLLVGMDVLSINNVDVSEMPSKAASAILSEAEGNITVLAKRPSLPPGSFVTAAIVKEEGVSLGVKMVGLKNGGVMIKSITPQSPASFTELEEGMVIRSINNVDTTTMGTKDVAKLLTADVASVTILANTTKRVAMGRASFRSMRSLSSGRSLGESIASSWNESQREMSKALETIRTEMGEEDSAPIKEVRAMSPISVNPIKTISPPDSPVAKGLSETVEIMSGGKRASFIVKNVVDC